MRRRRLHRNQTRQQRNDIPDWRDEDMKVWIENKYVIPENKQAECYLRLEHRLHYNWRDDMSYHWRKR